jgi:hypothetical protein
VKRHDSGYPWRFFAPGCVLSCALAQTQPNTGSDRLDRRVPARNAAENRDKPRKAATGSAKRRAVMR